MSHPYLSGAWEPQLEEVDASNLRVIEGEIPRDIAGYYLRNTENPVWSPIGRYHPFDGDGMIHAIHFKGDGSADYRNRFVRTAGYEAEQRAQQALWTGLAEDPRKNRLPNNHDASFNGNRPGAHGFLKDSASTDVVYHAGEILSLFYQCGDAYRIDIRSLETKGKAEWAGANGISAHAKHDPTTGNLLFFNYSKEHPYMHYGVVAPNNKLIHYRGVELPGCRLPHDMAFSQHYAVLCDFPLFWDPKLLAKGVMNTKYYPSMPSRFAVVPKVESPGNAPSTMWFESSPAYVLHFLNCYEDKASGSGDDVIVLDGYKQMDPFPSLTNLADHIKQITGVTEEMRRMMVFLDVESFKPKLWRWIFNLRTKETTEVALDSLSRNLEFGRFNALFATRKYRYAYSTISKPGWFLFVGLVKHDLFTGESQTLMFGENRFGSEAPFVPRHGHNGVGCQNEHEDDGYLVSFITDMNTSTSECVVINARLFAVVCRIALPHRISSGTHATWVCESELMQRNKI